MRKAVELRWETQVIRCCCSENIYSVGSLLQSWINSAKNKRKEHPTEEEKHIWRQEGGKAGNGIVCSTNDQIFFAVWQIVQRRWVFESKDKLVGRNNGNWIVTHNQRTLYAVSNTSSSSSSISYLWCSFKSSKYVFTELSIAEVTLFTHFKFLVIA